MNLVLSKLPGSLKVAACIGAGCGGTLTVQHYTASSSPLWDKKATAEKENGKGMKFEIDQLSKQLEEKEQSLKSWEELLAKQAADLKEQQAAMSSVQTQAAVVTTVAEPKPEQPVIDEAPFGEEESKNEKSKQSKGYATGNYGTKAEESTPDVPKLPAVFDGGGTPAVAFPPTADVVTVKEGGDEALQAELRAKQADLAKYEAELRRLEQRKDALEAELTEKDQQLERVGRLKEECERLGVTVNDLKGVGKDTQAEVKNIREELGAIQEKMAIVPKDGSFAVCRIQPKEASLWLRFWNCLFGDCLNTRRGALCHSMARNKKVDLSNIKECYTFVPYVMWLCLTSDPKGGRTVREGKDYYSVRSQPEGLLGRLLCCCRKKRVTEIRKLKYEEFAVDVVSEKAQNPVEIAGLSDVLEPEDQGRFGELLPKINGESFVSLNDGVVSKPDTVYASYEERGEPEVGNKYRTILFVFEPCFLLRDGVKKVWSACFGK